MPTHHLDRFSPGTRDAIEHAKKSVLQYRCAHLTPEHILLGLLAGADPTVIRVLSIGKASPAQIKILLEHHLRPGEYQLVEEQLALSERAKLVVEVAREECQRAKKPQIAPEHLLLGLTRVPNTVAHAVLAAVDLDTEALRRALNSNNP